MSAPWVTAAQVVGSVAAVGALIVSTRSVRTVRRTPLASSYLRAWEEIVDVVVAASDTGPGPVGRKAADELLHRFRVADRQLAVLESALGVKVFDGDVRAQINNLLIDVLYEDSGLRATKPFDDEIRPDWIAAETWRELGNSVPLTILMRDDVLFRFPGEPWSDPDSLLKWYAPKVVRDLRDSRSVYSPLVEPQYQVARLLLDYHDTFLEPWIKNATREALTGRRGLVGTRMRLHKLVHFTRCRTYLTRWFTARAAEVGAGPE